MNSTILRLVGACSLAFVLAGTAGAQNQALSVSVSPQGGYIEIPASPLLSPPSFTLEAWVTYDDSTLPAGWVFPTIGRKEFTQGVAEWFLRVDAGNNGARILRLWVNGSGGVVNVSSPFAAGAFLNWTHIAATYDGSFARLYVNGAQVAQSAGTGPLVDLGSVARIGAGDTAPGSANELWNGLLENVRIWSVARTQPEIAAGMFQQILSAPNLSASYRLDGNGLDNSGNNNHGAPVAGPSYVIVPTPAIQNTYCTAKTNSQGCVPSIGSGGDSSASSPSGFTISGVQALNNKIGILLYKSSVAGNGQGAIAFTGGFLCFSGAPNRTTPVLSGGTPAPTNDCTGVFAIDMNSFASGGITGPPLPQAYLLVSGQEVCAQFWGRDPGFPPPNNTQLTDGLTWNIGP